LQIAHEQGRDERVKHSVESLECSSRRSSQQRSPPPGRHLPHLPDQFEGPIAMKEFEE
jgi:hypothetical protein